MREAADEILRQVGDGTFRYAAEDPFDRAVEEAREPARCGDGDAAWRMVRAALPEWRPIGPEHLAPVGLCADPLLGPLITPERAVNCWPHPSWSQWIRPSRPVVSVPPDNAMLNAPTTLRDSRTHLPGNRTMTWEDEAPATVPVSSIRPSRRTARSGSRSARGQDGGGGQGRR
ncbi:hypothetical protein N4G69_21630 [Streptomyces mirabilis]|uniref:hypothetical protein n=1 Tax=Streptomyces mirabilis TaxID=68239 RepID=UPI0021BEB371|nr:hypothetical protein [Streptomyces mirabilis]MCT9108202.1 hypothetical protein [Streptomyces mirabilis]